MQTLIIYLSHPFLSLTLGCSPLLARVTNWVALIFPPLVFFKTLATYLVTKISS